MTLQPHPELPASLFKYATPATALAILRNKTLQFSRPGLFNDAFEARINLAINRDDEVVIKGALNQIWEAAYGPLPAQPGNSFGVALLAMRVLFPAQPPREAFDEFMRPQIAETLVNLEHRTRQLCDEVGEFCSKMKILCLSERPTIAPMWAGYCDNIQGVTLEFFPSTNQSWFANARPVTYLDEAPVLYDNASLIDLLSGRRSTNEDEIQQHFLFTKAADWAYEREWRIVAGTGWEPAVAREYVDFFTTDLRSVTFGIRSSDEFRQEIRAILAEKYPEAAVKQLGLSVVDRSYVVEDLP